MSAKISIIIPAYNAEKFLLKCVENLEKQTYKNTEIIIVNDGSTDKTIEVCESIKEKYDNVIVISQENGGPGKARESGLKQASGEYISFVDADDYIEPDAYKIIMETIIKEDCDIIQFGYCLTDIDGNVKETNPLYYENREERCECFDYFITQKNCTNFLCNKVYKYTLFHSIEWLRLYYSEDYAVLAQLYGTANHIITLPKVLYYYVQQQDSACNKPFNIRKLDQIKASEFVVEYTRRNFPDLTAKALFISCTNTARLAEKAYLSTYPDKNIIVDDMIEKFKIYYYELKNLEKKNAIEVKLDKMTKIFSMSPRVALLLKKLQNWKVKK